MSFASSAREEIAQRSPTKECCVRAAAYGIACFAKYFDARGLVLQTEQPHTVQLAQQLFPRFLQNGIVKILLNAGDLWNGIVFQHTG